MPIIARMRSRYCDGSAIGMRTAATITATTTTRGSERHDRQPPFSAGGTGTLSIASCGVAGGCCTA
jgi:hypothetical protein